MNTRATYSFIVIGLYIRTLASTTATRKINSVMEMQELLHEGLELVGFEVSLAFLQNSVMPALEKGLTLNSNDAIGDLLKGKIATAYRELENVVFAEAITKNTFELPARRFNSSYLLNFPEKLFHDKCFGAISELARMDISSSCRCILFGEGTAAAFHILRATENILTDYYFKYRKQKRLKKPMWGPMLEQLKARKNSPPPASLLDQLELIRVQYRNPTAHPVITYSIDEAQDLFGVCQSVIGKMTMELDCV